jgi:hypothetical protein
MDIQINPRRVGLPGPGGRVWRPSNIPSRRMLNGRPLYLDPRRPPTDEEVADQICSLPGHFTDISITAANVKVISGQILTGITGVTVTRGQTIYTVTATGLFALANAGSGATVATATCTGICLSDAAAGQEVLYFTGGQITIGGTVAVGTAYFVSVNNAGGICPVGDLTTGSYVSLLGMGISTTVIQVGIINYGITHA